MKRAIFLLLIVFIIYGFENKYNTISAEEEKDASIEESVVSEEELPPVSGETKKEVMSNEIKVESKISAEEEEEPTSETTKKIIAENRWGSTIYYPDPEVPNTGMIEHYSNRGVYLGRGRVK